MIRIADRVLKFGVPKEDIVVVGGGLLDALGLRESHDLDVMVRPEVFDALKKSGDYDTGISGDDEYCRKDEVEVWGTWYGETFDEVANGAVVHDGVRYLSPEKIIEFKQAKARPKDLADIELLKEYYDRD